ncbi:MAG: polyprenyl synthetase family protein [Bacteroidetes bacterium]|nr:polyprenyl synthetase family protein [Bacteroidota bacterium]
MKLDTIIAPVEGDLKKFEAHFRRSLKSNVGLVDAVVRYMVKRKGKRIRPALVMLSAGACGSINDATFRGAALVELLHTATLIHDDVVDDAETRRNWPSINAIWKNKVAVLLGDYVLSRGLLLSLENNDIDFLHSTSTAVKRMSEGELLQIQKSRQLRNDEETYFQIIGDKTASLLATCCEIGALSATKDVETVSRFRGYGENLGIAFQIRDDILDFTGTESTIGKPVGGDLKEKKFTLPLIHAFTNAPSARRKTVLHSLKRGVKRKDIDDIIRFVEEFGGIAYARKTAEDYRDRAMAQLAPLPDSESKQSLLQLADFVVTRKK